MTGYALGELPYQPGPAPQPGGGGGNIMASFLGRTVPAGDAIHSVALFLLNDEGTWLVRRPQQ